MKRMSILLSINGSAESRSAAHIAWQIAKQTGAKITAQHVIDSLAVWKFLSYTSSGFIGSGPYMEASERINEALRSISESLLLSYESQTEGQGLQSQSCIDEGDIVSSICQRAKDHDLVIVGSSLGQARDELVDLSKKCPSPLLVIQKSTSAWSRICVLLTDETVNEDTIWNISEFGSALGLSTELYLKSPFGKARTLRWASKLACGRNLPVVAIRHAYDGYAIGPAALPIVLAKDTTSGAEGNEAIKNYLSMDNSAIIIWPADSKKRSISQKNLPSTLRSRNCQTSRKIS